jgi:hypothetical protein
MMLHDNQSLSTNTKSVIFAKSLWRIYWQIKRPSMMAFLYWTLSAVLAITYAG